jgi:hypothetical protein
MAGIESSLAPEIYAILEGMEPAVLEEAMRILLVSNPTAAEIMSIRTAESLAGRWYEYESQRNIKRETLGKLLK